MFDRDQPVAEEELHAYVDGELAPERREAVEAWLATHPDDTVRVGAWRAQAESIRSRYGAVASEPVPVRFDLARLARRTWPWKSIAAAAALAFLIGGSAGWFGRDMWSEQASAEHTPFQQFTAEAVDAYNLYVVEVRHPGGSAGERCRSPGAMAVQACGLSAARPRSGKARLEARWRTAVAGADGTGRVLHV